MIKTLKGVYIPSTSSTLQSQLIYRKNRMARIESQPTEVGDTFIDKDGRHWRVEKVQDGTNWHEYKPSPPSIPEMNTLF